MIVASSRATFEPKKLVIWYDHSHAGQGRPDILSYALEPDLDPVAQLFVSFSQAFIANQV